MWAPCKTKKSMPTITSQLIRAQMSVKLVFISDRENAALFTPSDEMKDPSALRSSGQLWLLLSSGRNKSIETIEREAPVSTKMFTGLEFNCPIMIRGEDCLVEAVGTVVDNGDLLLWELWPQRPAFFPKRIQ
ncbi:hypothetical protein T265_08156 [Opisthorchis viverrini]|uniref:Uncharacterized protein n=1 Tax=Opisthorchis viverrini TaxID=6198 RepID=A0A075A9C5_OPIVI|nr:hypothetical protein T265_08156 [Opisthorchis viverrini]KER24114.1 hypothetical protein T265_08156 [Opisthorchis viverrini]